MQTKTILAYRIYPGDQGENYYAEDLSDVAQVEILFDYCQILEASIFKEGWQYLVDRFGFETLYEINCKSGWLDCENVEDFRRYVVQQMKNES